MSSGYANLDAEERRETVSTETETPQRRSAGPARRRSRGDALGQAAPHFPGRLPVEMMVLPCIEVDFLQSVLLAAEYDRNVEPLGEAGLVIGITPQRGLAMPQVSLWRQSETFLTTNQSLIINKLC